MTVVLGKRTDKEASFAAVARCLELFVLPGVSPADAAMITQHFTWLSCKTADLRVNARLETFPETQTTRIVLELSFAPELKPFVTN